MRENRAASSQRAIGDPEDFGCLRFFERLTAGVRNELIAERECIAHRTARLLHDELERARLHGNRFFAEDSAQVVAQPRCTDQPKVIPLAA